MRRALGIVATVLLMLAAASLGASPVIAQSGTGDVTLSLVAQTPWNSPKQDRLDVKVRASNEGDESLEGLALRVTIYDAMPSRGAYLESLTEDPAVGVSRTFPDIPVDDIAPTSTRDLRFQTPVRFLAEGAQEGRIYPMKMELLSDGAIVAILRTPIIFVAQPPEQPLDFGWTFVLSHPPLLEPNGTIVGRDLEHRIAPDGPLTGEVDALVALVRSTDAPPVDVAIAPGLLMLLTEMQDGYRVRTGAGVQTVAPGSAGAADAARILGGMRAIAAGDRVQVSAMPYASPSIPRLLESGLGQDLPAQLSLGRQSLTTSLAATPAPEILVPPGSAIDERAIGRLRAQGVQILPLDAGIIEQPEQPKAFAAPATARLDAGGNAFVTAIVPDPGTAALVSAANDDPRLAAQAVLADSAAVWLEDPSLSRSFALMAGQDVEAPAEFWNPLTRSVATAPWLHPTGLSDLVQRHPANDAPAERPHLNASRPEPFPTTYLERFAAAGQDIEQLSSILADPGATTLPQDLGRDLLFTESNALVNSRLGEQWLAAISARVADTFEQISIAASQVFTLTSSTGSIPVRLSNETGLDVNVVARIASQRLRVLGENPTTVQLGDTPVVLAFKVQAQATGRFPVQVTLETPARREIGRQQVVVRSTAYSRVALLITVGALLVLVGLWVRRLLAMRKARRS